MTEPWSDPGHDVLADIRAAVERGISEPRMPLHLTGPQRAAVALTPDGEALLRQVDAEWEMHEAWRRRSSPPT